MRLERPFNALRTSLVLQVSGSFLFLSVLIWVNLGHRLLHQSYSDLAVTRPGHTIVPDILAGEVSGHDDHAWQFDTARDARNYGLSERQCNAAFPGLFIDLESSVKKQKAKGSITSHSLDALGRPPNMTRAIIYENELFVLETTEDNPPGRPFATLLSINRALTSYQGKLPNIEFMFSTFDKNDNATLDSIWISSRRKERDGWLMPDFNFWSWVEPHAGGYSEVRRRMKQVEDDIGPFHKKEKKIVWRGNPRTAPILRGDLLNKTAGRKWADVVSMDWRVDNVAETLVPIEDLCGYQLIAATEGFAYSGRLKYILNCNSVIVSHKLQYVQPFQHLLVPEGKTQNYIEVERDWSNLEVRVTYYLKYPEEAQRIAQNAVQTFRDRYLTPAAEACYWRQLIRSWAEVSFEPDFYQSTVKNGAGERGWRAIPFESYILTRQLQWPIS